MPNDQMQKFKEKAIREAKRVTRSRPRGVVVEYEKAQNAECKGLISLYALRLYEAKVARRN